MELHYKNHKIIISKCPYANMNELLQYFHISRKSIYLMYQHDAILINHIPIHQHQSISEHDTIEILCKDAKCNEHVKPCFDEIKILYEDELLLIVNKPNGIIVHSDGTSKHTTLYDMVKGYYIMQGYTCPVRAIHRLDKDTSGAVIFCKIAFFQPLLDHMLKEKKIERRYIALVEGILNKKTFTIHAPIGKDRHHSQKMRVSTNGKEASTKVMVLQRYKDYTQIECRLHQGRTHQIRVHLTSIGHPLLHDTLYGNHDSRIKRCALHAYCVLLYHPLYQKELRITCALPDDMQKLLTKRPR